ncbi:hypothetical protein H6G74_16835 [Nostoc spongiaeforme FACHB-130]|uniref:Uncharacterized protein n=1 Tax=Nostoc spongiaeforme FACHB-130 TaxID=1357510 RepID=A0ABR8FX21_9NOSO|nr:hypothetical protein [Nostoc spongiaeforme]MBD2595981.1 hypothetical protein [Nostoc spongiaeforme FACHB-130]
MSNRHYPPAYLRYLKARLWNFSKPAFWGTAIFLSVLGLVIREYWTNPDAFTGKQDGEVTTPQADNSSLSAEDKAIAADIDNLPVLYNDVEQAETQAIVSSPTDNSKPKKGKDFLQDVINKQKSSKNTKSTSILGISGATSGFDSKNPFVAQTESLLQFGIQNGSGNQLLNSSSQPQGSTNNPYAVGTGTNQTPNNPYNSITPSATTLPTSTNPYNSITPSTTTLPTSTNQTTTSNINSATANPGNSFGQTPYTGLSQNLSNINGTTTNFSNNSGRTSYTSIPQSLPTNTQNFLPNSSLNSGTSYIQPSIPSQPTNYYNGVNTAQPLTNSVPSINTTQPINSVAPTNTTPSAVQNSSAYIVTPAAPASYQNNRYFRGLPVQIPSNTSVPGQYTGGVQGNPYGY